MSSVDEIRARLLAATPGPWDWGSAPHPDGPEATFAEWVEKTHGDLDASTGWAVWCAPPPDEPYDFLVPAVTGNGPTSKANAEFIAHARDDIEALLAVAEAAQNTLDTAMRAAGHPGDGTGPTTFIECEVIWSLLHDALDRLQATQPRGDSVMGEREWVEIRSHRGNQVTGWIPRDVLEGLGIDCSSLDRQPQGTSWFNREQSDAIRHHPEWKETLDD